MSVLKRLLAVDFRLLIPKVRFTLLGEIQAPEFLAYADHWYFKRILGNSPNQEELFALLDSLIETVEFNAFHYNLLKFYKKQGRNQSTDSILARIEELRIR